METTYLFMPLPRELGALGDTWCYKQVAPNGARAFQRQPFKQGHVVSNAVISERKRQSGSDRGTRQDRTGTQASLSVNPRLWGPSSSSRFGMTERDDLC